ncbi:hypothetical protein V6N13_007971 [Hibiscus sabdariffa]
MNPNSLNGDPDGTTADGFPLSDHDHDNRRPPECVPTILVGQGLERMGVPLEEENSREAKKGRHTEDFSNGREGSDTGEMDTDGSSFDELMESATPILGLSKSADQSAWILGRPMQVLCVILAWLTNSCPKSNPQRAYEGVVNRSSSDSNANATINKEPEDLFGPWMTVDNRQRRAGNRLSGARNKSSTTVVAEGSRFAALEADAPETTPVVVADSVAPLSSRGLADTGLVQPLFNPANHVQPHGVDKNATYLASNPQRRMG